MLPLIPLETGEASAALSVSDVVVVAVKAHQLKDLRGTLVQLRHQVVVLPQNGLGIIEEARASGLSNEIGPVRMLCRFGVRREGPYDVQHAGGRGVTAWSLNNLKAQVWTETLSTAGFEVEQAQSLVDAEWSKALINVFVNPICAILNTPNRAIIEDDTLFALALELYREAYLVARKDGYTGEPGDKEDLRRTVAPFGDNINSHLEDLRVRRPSDMHFLLGTIVGRAKSFGMRAPRIETVYGLYQALEKRRMAVF
jgi:2-dehydropantoate 2-reductase